MAVYYEGRVRSPGVIGTFYPGTLVRFSEGAVAYVLLDPVTRAPGDPVPWLRIRAYSTASPVLDDTMLTGLINCYDPFDLVWVTWELETTGGGAWLHTEIDYPSPPPFSMLWSASHLAYAEVLNDTQFRLVYTSELPDETNWTETHLDPADYPISGYTAPLAVLNVERAGPNTIVLTTAPRSIYNENYFITTPRLWYVPNPSIPGSVMTSYGFMFYGVEAVYLYVPGLPPPDPGEQGPGDRTVFEQDLGTKQGRIPNPRAPGTFVYELGHADRLVELFADDSLHEITQEVLAEPDTKLLRARVHVKAPRTVSDRAWVLTVRLGAVVFYSRTIEPDGREFVIDDIAVSTLGGLPRMLVFRLALGGP